VLDLDRRVLNKLVGESGDRLGRLTEPVVLVAHELTPGRAASLNRATIVGVTTDAGGRTSHASIVAGALGIPVVVGCQHVTEHVDDDDQVVIDGKNGLVIIRPDAETLEQYEADVVRMGTFQIELREAAQLEPVTPTAWGSTARSSSTSRAPTSPPRKITSSHSHARSSS
jgi:phosphotransferase system enzyme I (PtsI)